MSYITGFVAAVPAANKEKYLKHAGDAWPLFKEFGIKSMVETWGDDVPVGKVTDFRRAVKAEEGEAIVFSWFMHNSKEDADAANEKMISDPRMAQMGSDMPFDGKRMIFGGFSVVVDTGSAEKPGYVDGTVMPVPNDARAAFHDNAAQLWEIFLEYGATRVVDAWGDDLPKGKVTDFQGAVNATDSETVVFGWVEWPSKSVRDEAWEKVMSDSRMTMDGPQDMQRAIFGGFVPIVYE